MEWRHGPHRWEGWGSGQYLMAGRSRHWLQVIVSRLVCGLSFNSQYAAMRASRRLSWVSVFCRVLLRRCLGRPRDLPSDLEGLVG